MKNSWLTRQSKDLFVKKSKLAGYRSRAAYKLLEIQQKHNIIKLGMKIIELGAAPGSWSQVIVDLIANHGQLIAVDILTIEPIKHADIIQGDFTEPATVDKIYAMAKDRVDLVLSDLAPNLSGTWVVDMPKIIYLAELVMDLVKNILKQDGGLLIKLFNGQGFDNYIALLRQYFTKIIICKPRSSRQESREVYILAKGYCGLL